MWDVCFHYWSLSVTCQETQDQPSFVSFFLLIFSELIYLLIIQNKEDNRQYKQTRQLIAIILIGILLDVSGNFGAPCDVDVQYWISLNSFCKHFFRPLILILIVCFLSSPASLFLHGNSRFPPLAWCNLLNSQHKILRFKN